MFAFLRCGIRTKHRLNGMKTKLIYRMISKATPRRLWNAFVVYASYRISRLLRRPIQWGLPIGLSVEPTTSCNLRCPQCPSGLRSFSRPTGMLDLPSFKRWLRPISGRLWTLQLYFQGEPLLHPGFSEAVRIGHDAGLFTMSSTNGHFLTEAHCHKLVESGLDLLVISIDGVDQERYQEYRVGGSLEKVLDGSRELIRIRKQLKSKTPYLIFQMVVFRHNRHQIEAAKELARQIGFDEIRFKTAQVYDADSAGKLIPEEAVYTRYARDESGRFGLKNSLPDHCWRLWHSPVVSWDGKVLPCCFDKDAQHIMGELPLADFSSIWRGERYGNFRRALLRDRRSTDICRNCSEGNPVWITPRTRI